jgi:hypothetical protein
VRSEGAGCVTEPRNLHHGGLSTSPRSGERKADLFGCGEGSSPFRRNGEPEGHHRGPRAGHALRGVAWELGRATYLLVEKPEDEGYRMNKSPGADRPVSVSQRAVRTGHKGKETSKVSGSE